MPLMALRATYTSDRVCVTAQDSSLMPAVGQAALSLCLCMYPAWRKALKAYLLRCSSSASSTSWETGAGLPL